MCNAEFIIRGLSIKSAIVIFFFFSKSTWNSIHNPFYNCDAVAYLWWNGIQWKNVGQDFIR